MLRASIGTPIRGKTVPLALPLDAFEQEDNQQSCSLELQHFHN